MKKTLAFFTLLLGLMAMFAQSGPTFPYQAVVRNSQNQLIKDSTFAVDVAIYQGATLKFSETQSVTTNANGQFTMNIGGGTLVSGAMGDIADWSVAKFKVTCHLSGGDIVSENAVSPVPYALQAANATSAATGNFLTSDSAVITTMQSNIVTNTTDIATNTADIAALANRVNTFNTNVCDSVATCVGNAIDARGFLTSDSAVITTMQSNIATNTTNIAANADDIAALANRVNTFNTNVCDSVKDCDFSGNASIQNMLQELSDLISAQNHKIDSLAHIVDSLSNINPVTPTDTFTCGTSKVKDVDNNEYNTVKIGNQCWMAQNLRTSTNAAGAGNIYTPTASEVPGYDVNTYGRLYDWAAVMQGASSSDAVPSGVQGICPTGWHVPSDAEWTTMTDYVKSQSEYVCPGCSGTDDERMTFCIAKALSSTTGWNSDETTCNVGNAPEGNNLTGFAAVPAGCCFGGYFDVFGYNAYFWSATQYDNSIAWYRYLASVDFIVDRLPVNKEFGFSVRCLRDAGIGGGDEPSEPDTPVTPTGPFTCGTSKVKDAQNNEYNTVKIGNQCWTKENLRTTSSIGVTYYPASQVSNVATYGLLYDWAAAMQDADAYTTMIAVEDKHQGICPTGWHVPSQAEWDALTKYTFDNYKCDDCGGSWAAGVGVSCIAKALASPLWTGGEPNSCSPNTSDNDKNATGFSALPAGCVANSFESLGNVAGFWSTTQYDNSKAYARGLVYNETYVSSVDDASKVFAVSVRCLRDAGVGDTPGDDEPTIVDTVTCYPNLGSNVPEKKTVTRGENLDLSTTFTHPAETNWEIAGWNTSADGTGTSYTNTITTSGNLTLYAQWHTFCTGTPNTSVNEFGSNRIDSLQDADNNKYTVVQIGNQCWMKENLRTTKKPNNEAITEGMWEPGSNSVETYGRLYDWTTMMNGGSSSEATPSGVQGICPTGWHVPSDAEWKQMEMAVGMSESDANGTLFRGSIAAKLSGNTGWNSSTNDDAPGNTYAPDRNSTGFSALPAGYYYRVNGHNFFSQGAYFWSATARGRDDEAYGRSLHFAKAGVSRAGNEYIHGFSVRCVRD